MTIHRSPRRSACGCDGWWRQPVTLRPRRSCKDHLHPCAVPDDGAWGLNRTNLFRSSDGRVDRDHYPGELARMPIIEIGSPEWRSGARPSSYIRNLAAPCEAAGEAWWVTKELNLARTKAQALQTRSVTRLGVTRNDEQPSFAKATEGILLRAGSARPAKRAARSRMVADQRLERCCSGL